MPGTLLDAALELAAAGVSVIPVRGDGSKAPAVPWKPYTAVRADEATIRAWFPPDGKAAGVGVVTGDVSGRLEMLEVEGRAAARVPDLAELADGSGLTELWARISTGWVEQSPSGGLHWFYRLDGPVPGNTKLAVNASNETLAETRGEHGFAVAAPTPGTAHETGQPWLRIIGGPGTIPTVTTAERAELAAIFVLLLDERPAGDPSPSPTALTWGVNGASDGTRPGDDYERRTDWAEILQPHGWTLVRATGRERFWRRPDKTIGLSASTGHADDRDRLYVWSSSTPFPTEQSITKFRAYAILNHDGDNQAAARQLARDGYGTRPNLTLVQPPAAAAPSSDGTAALAPQPQPTPAPPTYTDDGNALLLAQMHGHHIRYVAQRKQWLTWDGGRWAWDDAGQVVEHAKDTIRRIDTAGDDVLFKHVIRSLNRRALDAMVALTRTIPGIVIDAGDLDAHPDQLNTPAGIIDLTTGKLTPPNPDGLHTRSTATAPQQAPTPRWDTFLAETFRGHATLLPYLQRLAGYSATGRVTHHVLPFLHGSGQNGKSVFIDVMRKLLGDYATTTGANFLMAGRDHHAEQIARLHGMRFVVTSEVNEGDRFDEAKVKWLTGGDAISANFMHENSFTFTPSHTLWMMGNKQPHVGSGGDSFWRRLRLIEFANKVPDERKNPDLADEILADEGPGILQWIIDGAVAAHHGGLQDPAEVLAATLSYAAEEDHIARFIEDRIIVAVGGRVDQAEVRAAYERWCNDAGEKPLAARSYLRELRLRLPLEEAKSHGRRLFKGILLPAPEEAESGSQWWDK